MGDMGVGAGSAARDWDIATNNAAAGGR